MTQRQACAPDCLFLPAHSCTHRKGRKKGTTIKGGALTCLSSTCARSQVVLASSQLLSPGKGWTDLEASSTCPKRRMPQQGGAKTSRVFGLSPPMPKHVDLRHPGGFVFVGAPPRKSPARRYSPRLRLRGPRISSKKTRRMRSTRVLCSRKYLALKRCGASTAGPLIGTTSESPSLRIVDSTSWVSCNCSPVQILGP